MEEVDEELQVVVVEVEVVAVWPVWDHGMSELVGDVT